MSLKIAALKSSGIKSKGLGRAENTAIKYASTDCMCFLDNDDYMLDRFVRLLYKAIREENFDVVVWDILSDECRSYFFEELSQT